jgi:hypothetical protein
MYLQPVLDATESSTNNARMFKDKVSAYFFLLQAQTRRDSLGGNGLEENRAISSKNPPQSKRNTVSHLMTSTAREHDKPSPDKSLLICSNKLLAIPGRGNKFWKTCCKAINSIIVPKHGLKGNMLNNILDPDSDVFLSLFWFFEDNQELAEPRAIRLVHKLTNNGVGDDNETSDFPAWMMKRDLYCR